MPTEQIDFDKHSCEDFPGKTLIINGIEYEIGEYIGMGGSKITYELINVEAKVSHHIIKIYFGPYEKTIDAAAYEVNAHARVKIAVGPDGALITPCTFSVESNGGIFLVQEYAVPSFRRKFPAIDKISARAEKLMKSAPAAAAGLFEEMLRLNPHDTVALHNMAICYANQKNWEKAFEYQTAAVNIEPNFCLFAYHYIRICLHLQLFAKAIEENDRIRALYPHPHNSDEDLLDILLAFGRPEEAEIFLEEMYFESEDEKTRLREIVDKDLEAKKQTRQVYDTVFNLIRKGEREKCFGLIENAVKIYPRDIFLLAGYAFGLRIRGKYDAAAELLIILSRRVYGTSFYRIFLANGIYCCLLGTNPKLSVQYFRQLYNALTIGDTGIPKLDPVQFPGVGIFALRDEFFIEEHPQVALDIWKKARLYVDSEQGKYLDFFCNQLGLALEESAAGNIPPLLFDE